MTRRTPLAPLLERFFTERLLRQRQVSPHTVASYRDTFRLLLTFVHHRQQTVPAQLTLEAVDGPLISAFLDYVEAVRGVSVRSRNLRLTAIHSFFRYAAFECPTHAAQIQRVLAIPTKRVTRRQIAFLTRPEIDALLAVPDRRTWRGRRDHALLLLAVQTGLRLSELTALTRSDVVLTTGAHVRVIGKGRKERCTPLAKPTIAVLRAWLDDPPRGDSPILFPTARGTRLSADAVAYLVAKHRAAAAPTCPSLQRKRLTPHVLRHNTETSITVSRPRPVSVSAARRIFNPQVVRIIGRQSDSLMTAVVLISDDTILRPPARHRAFPEWTTRRPHRRVRGTPLRAGV